MPDAFSTNTGATGHATGATGAKRSPAVVAPEKVPSVNPTVPCQECACDVKTDQVLFEEVHGHKFCYCASASFVTRRKRCLGPLPTDKRPACSECVCAADEQPFGQVHTFKTFGGSNACLCAGKAAVGRSRLCTGELPTQFESMLDCSLAKCSGGDKQRVVFQALGDTTRFYCADTATGNPVTAPARCKGYVNAKKLCSACRCNAQGRAPELVFERLNGNSICYCKGEEGKTISEVCAGPLPSAGKAAARAGTKAGVARTGGNHMLATMLGDPRHARDQKHLSMESKSALQRLRQALTTLVTGNASFQEMLSVIKSLSHQVKADKNSADLIHAIDAKGCGHSIAEYSNEVKQALERRQQCVAEVKARGAEATAVQREFIKLVDSTKFGLQAVKGIKRKMGILGKIEQAEREQDLASRRSDKVLKETLRALGGKVEEGLKKSDPSADDEAAAFLEKESDSDILKRQESKTVDNRASNAMARRLARRMGTWAFRRELS